MLIPTQLGRTLSVLWRPPPTAAAPPSLHCPPPVDEINPDLGCAREALQLACSRVRRRESGSFTAKSNFRLCSAMPREVNRHDMIRVIRSRVQSVRQPDLCCDLSECLSLHRPPRRDGSRALIHGQPKSAGHRAASSAACPRSQLPLHEMLHSSDVTVSRTACPA